MSAFSELLKNTLAGGLFVVLPVLLVILILREVFEMLVAIADPISTLVGIKGLTEGIEEIVVAIVLLVVVSLLVGLASRTKLGLAVGRWIEQGILNRMPSYRLLRTLSRRFSGDESDSRFVPAVVLLPMDTRVLAFIVEEHGGDDVTVFVPAAPTPAMGTIHVLPRERVKKLDASLAEIANCLADYGIGAGKLLALDQATKPKGDTP